jgi:hypothetical protein
MPSPSPAATAIPLDYQRPSVDPIVFRDGSDLVVRGGSDFSSHCVCCARPAAGKPVQLRCIDPVDPPKPSSHAGGSGGLFEILLILLWAAIERLVGWCRAQTPARVVRYCLCPFHRRRRLIFGICARAAFFGGLAVFAYGAWAANHAAGLAHDLATTLMIAGPIIGSLIAVGFAFHRPRLSVSRASGDHRLFWLRHACPDFLNAQPPLPRS